LSPSIARISERDPLKICLPSSGDVRVRKSDAQEVSNFIDEKTRTKTDQNEKINSICRFLVWRRWLCTDQQQLVLKSILQYWFRAMLSQVSEKETGILQ
jgi:hypothetical protein